MVGADAVLLAEVAEVLSAHGRIRCIPMVELTDTATLTVTLTVRRRDDGKEALEVVSLKDDLQYVVDVAQMRALCNRYDIDARVLEALLEKREP